MGNSELKVSCPMWNLTGGTSHKKYDSEPLKISAVRFSRTRRAMEF
jgi:hypothetical protein